MKALPGMKSLRSLAAAVLMLLGATSSGAQVPDDVKIGAIRWDSWYEGAPDQRVLEQPGWRHRAPFFARWDEDGRLHLEGDRTPVLQAEVAYARAIGVDYFIFGFYPETGSWGRDVDRMRKINGALRTYLALPDRMAVKFAVSINQLFPASDAPAMAEAVAGFAAHPDYMRTDGGALPVFILAHDGLDWSKFFGTDEAARSVIRLMRQRTRERTGRDIIFVILNYRSDLAWRAALAYGLDMVSSYANFAPGKGAEESSYERCALHGEGVWHRAAEAQVPYAPNVTLGWDERPRKTAAKEPQKRIQGPWCALPSPGALAGHFARAAAFARQRPVPFRTITVYAWNEFTEGGWMAPTQGDGARWMSLLRQAIGRQRTAEIKLSWPVRDCEGLAADRRTICLAAQEASRWPCPPGSRAEPGPANDGAIRSVACRAAGSVKR